MSDYYQMQRGWQDHDLFDGDEFSRRDAFEWLIANANWKDSGRRIAGKIIGLQRGQLSHSLRFLADRWKWSKAKVEWFIMQLVENGMIRTESGHGQMVITICNYENYQYSKNSKQTEYRTATGQQQDSNRTNKKQENITTNVVIEIDPREFENFWDTYPYRKGSKARAKQLFTNARKSGVTYDELMRAAGAYAGYIHATGTERRFTKNAETWLGRERHWETDWDSAKSTELAGRAGKDGGKLQAKDARDPASRARDIGEEIIAKRRAERATAEAGRLGAGPTDPLAVPDLRQPADLRGQGPDDGISGPDVPDGAGRLSVLENQGRVLGARQAITEPANPARHSEPDRPLARAVEPSGLHQTDAENIRGEPLCNPCGT